MASGRKGKPTGKEIAPVSSDYGTRAALALNGALPGEHRDKLVARMFNCSVRMAKYLRAGQYWTVDRLNQASRVIGPAFDLTVASGEQHRSEMQDIADRLGRLEGQFAQVVRREDAGSAPPRRAEGGGSSGASGQGEGPCHDGGSRA